MPKGHGAKKNRHGGAGTPVLGDTQEPDDSVSADYPRVVGGRHLDQHVTPRLSSTPGDGWNPKAYGGAPTMVTRGTPKSGSGSGDRSGAPATDPTFPSEP